MDVEFKNTHKSSAIVFEHSPTIFASDRETGEHLDKCRFMVTGDFVDGATSIAGLDHDLTGLMRGNVRINSMRVTALGGVTCAEPVEGGQWHAYTVRELSGPAGYQIEPTSLDFVVNEYGTLYLTSESVKAAQESGTPASVIQGKAGKSKGSGSGAVFSFSVPQTMVSIRKVDEHGRALSGATFRLEGEHVVLDESGRTTGQTSTDPMIFTVDSTGRINLTGVLIASGSVINAAGEQENHTYTYTLTEVSAPNGYEVLDEPIVFTLSPTNELAVSKGAGVATVSTDDATAVLTVANRQKKAGDSGGTKGAVTTSVPQTSDPTHVGLPAGQAVCGLVMVLFGCRRRRRAGNE